MAKGKPRRRSNGSAIRRTCAIGLLLGALCSCIREAPSGPGETSVAATLRPAEGSLATMTFDMSGRRVSVWCCPVDFRSITNARMQVWVVEDGVARVVAELSVFVAPSTTGSLYVVESDAVIDGIAAGEARLDAIGITGKGQRRAVSVPSTMPLAPGRRGRRIIVSDEVSFARGVTRVLFAYITPTSADDHAASEQEPLLDSIASKEFGQAVEEAKRCDDLRATLCTLCVE